MLSNSSSAITPRSYTVAMDPGVHGCGLAIGTSDGTLIHACYVPNSTSGRGDRANLQLVGAVMRVIFSAVCPLHIAVVAVEWPQTYKGTSYRPDVDETDLRELRHIDELFLSCFPRHTRRAKFSPHDWKRTISKKSICRARLEKGMSKEELKAVRPAKKKDLDHNTWDAVGIFKHATNHPGRLVL